jgi:hypothetical protein
MRTAEFCGARGYELMNGLASISKAILGTALIVLTGFMVWFTHDTHWAWLLAGLFCL